MASVLVMPMHDPSGVLFPHLQTITPQLAELFAGAFVGITAATAEAQPEWVDRLETHEFYRSIIHRAGLAVGDQFRELYASAAAAYRSETFLHLCFVDRLAFILQSEHSQAFIADMQTAHYDESLLIFHRSEAAWATHPANYWAAEQMITTAGQLLFGRTLDFAWCHIVIRTDALGAIIPRTKQPDMSVVAEIVVQAMGQRISTKDVDWLAWEDPFLFGRDARQLKREREASLQETRKRLAYVIPMLQLVYAAADGPHSSP
jgi:hypothetical protein